MEKLIKSVEIWSLKYDFNFQFWGPGNNNVWIYKDDVELFSSGGNETIEDVLKAALSYVNKVNPKGQFITYP